MPLLNTSGNVTADAFGGGVAAVPNYIEECFSTWLYQGNGTGDAPSGNSQTITNGIDLAGKGGLVWVKNRSSTRPNALFDTTRGVYQYITSNGTGAQVNLNPGGVSAFNSSGFTVFDDSTSTYAVNASGFTYASWTFRKQPKFFDVVTWTGDGVAGRQISHSLGSAPGAIIVKCTSVARDWAVWQNTLSDGTYLKLNTTDSVITNTSFQVFGNASGQTSTYFTVGQSGSGVNGLTNANGDTYVAYIFADDAGGFGLTGTDNVISCGSYTGTGSALSVTLGYEPQWILVKRATGGTNNWVLMDTMRGMSLTSAMWLYPNLSDAEVDAGTQCNPTATGFTITSTGTNLNAGGETYIYIAIRRGPMKVPTSGTSVFLPTSRTGNASLTTVTSGFAPDVVIGRRVDTLDNGNESVFADKLRGSGTLSTNNTDAEYAGGATSGLNAYTNTGVVIGTNNSPIYAFNYSGLPYALYQFQRAPSFMDEVCYTGTGAGDNPRTFTHNLQVVPELMIIKRRNSTAPWIVYSASQGASKYATLNTTDAFATADEYLFNNTAPTASVFTVGSPNGASSYVNASGGTYVNYLFATCAGVSKVGSYTGTGATQTISCGFTGGARFVLIKRTDSTGNWYVWDTARGMVSGTDPKFGFNLTTAQTNADWVYTTTGGFQIVTSDADVNASGGTYIFLAIA